MSGRCLAVLALAFGDSATTAVPSPFHRQLRSPFRLTRLAPPAINHKIMNNRCPAVFRELRSAVPVERSEKWKTNRSGGRKRFLTDHRSLPQHFGAATACSLNSQHILSQLLPTDLRKTARRITPITRKIQLKLHSLSPFVLASFVCFGGSSLFVCIRGDSDSPIFRIAPSSLVA